jgi:hypothetical protein
MKMKKNLALAALVALSTMANAAPTRHGETFPTYDCSSKITVILTDSGIAVLHHVGNKVVRRNEQYRNYQTGRNYRSEEVQTVYFWMGVLKSNPAYTMKGEFVMSDDGDFEAEYTERVSKDGKLVKSTTTTNCRPHSS